MPKTDTQVKEWFKENYNIDIPLAKSDDVFLEQHPRDEKSPLGHDPFKDNYKLSLDNFKILGDRAPMAVIAFFKWYYAESEKPKEAGLTSEQILKKLNKVG